MVLMGKPSFFTCVSCRMGVLWRLKEPMQGWTGWLTSLSAGYGWA